MTSIESTAESGSSRTATSTPSAGIQEKASVDLAARDDGGQLRRDVAEGHRGHEREPDEGAAPERPHERGREQRRQRVQRQEDEHLADLQSGPWSCGVPHGRRAGHPPSTTMLPIGSGSAPRSNRAGEGPAGEVAQVVGEGAAGDPVDA